MLGFAPAETEKRHRAGGSPPSSRASTSSSTRARDGGQVQRAGLGQRHPAGREQFLVRGGIELMRDCPRIGHEEPRIETARAIGRRDGAGDEIQACPAAARFHARRICCHAAARVRGIFADVRRSECPLPRRSRGWRRARGRALLRRDAERSLWPKHRAQIAAHRDARIGGIHAAAGKHIFVRHERHAAVTLAHQHARSVAVALAHQDQRRRIARTQRAFDDGFIVGIEWAFMASSCFAALCSDALAAASSCACTV